MSDEKETKIIVPESELTEVPDIVDPEQFEGIAAPLTAGTTTWSESSVGGDLVCADDTGLYYTRSNTIFVDGSRVFGLQISKRSYSNGSVITSFGSNGILTLASPSGPPPSGSMAWNIGNNRYGPWTVNNNLIYVINRWSRSSTLETYNLSDGSHNSRILTFDRDPNLFSSIVLEGSSLIMGRSGHASGVDYSTIEEYSLSTGARIATSSGNFSITGIAATPSRIYISGWFRPGNTPYLYALNRNAPYAEVSADRTRLTSQPDSVLGSRFNGVAIRRNVIYIWESTTTPSRRLYSYNLPDRTFTASWSTADVATDRSVRLSLTLSEIPLSGTFDIDTDFEIQNSSGVTQSTGWTIRELGIGYTIRQIEILPAQSVSAGTYRIVLNEDAFGTDQPASDVVSANFTIPVYTPVITVQSIAPPTSSPQSPNIASSSTFVLTLSREVPVGEIQPADFGTSTSGATVSTVTPRTATNASVFDIIVNNPTGVGSYTLTLNAETISAMGSIYAASPSYAFSSLPVYYGTTPVRIAVETFSPASMVTQTGTTTTFVLTLNRVIPKTGQLTNADFTFNGTSGATIASITGRGTGTTAYIFDIVVNNPSSGSGSYGLVLRENAISAGTGYLEGPIRSTRSTVTTFDRRPTVSVTSFAPTQTSSAQNPVTTTTSTFRLVLGTAIPRTGTGSIFNNRAIIDVDGDTLRVQSVTGVGTGSTTTTFDIVIWNGNYGGSYQVILRRNSILSTSTTSYRQGPDTDQRSESLYIERRLFASVNSFTAPDATQIGSTTTLRLTLNRVIPVTGSLDTNDFDPEMGSGVSVASVTAVVSSQSATTTSIFNIVVNNPSSGTGTYTISLNADSISSSTVRGPRDDYTSEQVTYNRLPIIQVTGFQPHSTTTEQNPTTAATMSFSLNFSQSISKTGQLTASDFTIPAGASVGAITGLGMGTTSAFFTVVINNPTNSTGNYTLQLNANAIAGTTTYNTGPTSNTNAINAVYYDTRRALTATWQTVTQTQTTLTSEYTLTLSRAIPRTGQLSTTDFSVSNSAVSVTSVSGQGTGATTRFFDVEITHPTNSSGSYMVTLDQDAIASANSYLSSPAMDTDSGSINFETRAFGGTWQAAPVHNADTGRISANIRFSHRVDGIAAADFEVVPADTEVNQNWTFITPSSSVNANTNLLVQATVPANTNGSFRIKLKAGMSPLTLLSESPKAKP